MVTKEEAWIRRNVMTKENMQPIYKIGEDIKYLD